ncbi:phospholipase/carboxylesterase [Albidovulum inexpectatum]|uniref:Phospholipase/carboxylesterase n=1 Tax=Albidovulum inexpectatum TaxID=196587 RepID=A0A2S5JJF1_9RHOB|nr:alpha/beta fold hydrolase [Albidovulum inexpectatum]PPB81637.1 phospholipase/carboxylesterase [Albidovulum inexpectatum]
MIRELRFGRRPAKSGQANAMVIFLHGYGADGADLLGLADPLAPHLPNTVFIAPDAPEKCRNNPFGYQWFPIPWLDGSSEEESRASFRQSVDDLNAFIDARLAEEAMTPDQLAVVGFSQGTMMALHVLPRRPEPVAAIVGFSGRLLDPELLEKEAVSKPPVLLCHGDQDPMVPFADMQVAGQALSQAGFETYAHVMKGTGHGISPDGLSAALGFLRQKLPQG